MNFLSVFVSTFITNYFFSWIISLLPIRNKRKTTIIILSIFNLISIGYSCYQTINYFILGNISTAIYLAGNLIASLIGYLAIMMILLDGVKVFKTRRQRAFLNSINDNKSGIPYYAMIAILLILGTISLVYALITTFNYESKFLWSLIGAYSIAALLFILVMYLLITNFKSKTNPNIKIIKNNSALIFILDINGKKTIYESKNFNDENLKALSDIYYFTDYGYLITPDFKYSVKGIKVDRISADLVKEIKMDIVNNDAILNIINRYQRYQTKTIYIDNNNNITKEITK